MASDINAQPLFLLYNKAQSPAFADPTNYSGLGGAITAYVTSTTFRASIAIGEGGLWSYAAGVIRHYFTVDRPTQVILEWDLRAAAPEFAWVYLTDAYLGGLALDDGSEYRNGFFVNTGAGEASLDLLPGVVYRFDARVNTWLLSGMGDVYVQMSVVPAPGGVALALTPILLARRRRRT